MCLNFCVAVIKYQAYKYKFDVYIIVVSLFRPYKLIKVMWVLKKPVYFELQVIVR